MTATMRIAWVHALAAALAGTVSAALCAQEPRSGALPEAPAAQTLAQEGPPRNPAMIEGRTASSERGDQGAPSDAPARLTRAEAEQMAIRNNPRIRVSRLLALAQHQAVREARAAELPTASASLTAADAENASRISAGSLTASRLFEHAGAGGSFSQLITNFGRTSNLVASARLDEKARNADALATTADVVLATDQAFFNAEQARALLKVAQQNTSTLMTTDSQVTEMTKNKLKSTLDQSFADVNLSQAKLLELDAENNAASTMAALDAVLGLDRPVNYELVDDSSALNPPPSNADQLVETALAQRPDLQSANLSQQSAVKLSRAQRDQMLPSITALGTAGAVPIRPDGTYYINNWWGGIGVNMNIPIFNGFLYSAQAKEAAIRAQAAAEQSRDLRDRIVRDVRTAWLAANTAYQRVAVTDELLKQANLALGFAQTRYKLGLSSIVELSQAEYQQTDAAIGNTNAQYQYRLALTTLNYQIGATP